MALFKKRDSTKLPDIRDMYDAAYFNGRSLNTDTHQSEGEILWNLLKQGEVHRLDTKDQLASIADSLAKLVETQQALLETQRAILEAVRLPEADLDKLNRASFFRAGPTPSL